MSQIGTEKPEGDLSLARPSVDGLEIEIVKDGDEPALRITFREHVRSLGFAYSRASVRLEALGPDMLEVALQVEDERPQWNEDRTGVGGVAGCSANGFGRTVNRRAFCRARSTRMAPSSSLRTTSVEIGPAQPQPKGGDASVVNGGGSHFRRTRGRMNFRSSTIS